MKQRGIYEKVRSSCEWWIRLADIIGRIRRRERISAENATRTERSIENGPL